MVMSHVMSKQHQSTDNENEFPGVSIHGQRFTIAVVRHRLVPTMYNVNLVVRVLKPTQPKVIKLNRSRLSLADAREFAVSCAEHISSPLSCVNYRQGLPHRAEIILSRNDVTLIQLPSEALKNPDDFIAPGDEIFVQCKSLNVRFFHSGIYGGDERVFHFMGDPIDQVASLAEVIFSKGSIHMDPWLEFVYSNLSYEPTDNITPTLYRVQYPLRVRSGEHIVSEAERLFRCGSKFIYDLRRNNCQHFSSYCCTGRPFSYDMAKGFKSMACSLLELSCSLRKCDESKFFGCASDDDSSSATSTSSLTDCDTVTMSSVTTNSNNGNDCICVRF
uniref:LRAT domain-containing protein n=1 Tax=Panagrellus redivivus TaxID=6233 RepID=A0A7E4V039_PANRE